MTDLREEGCREWQAEALDTSVDKVSPVFLFEHLERVALCMSVLLMVEWQMKY